MGKPLKHPDAIARDKWLEENPHCVDPTTLGASARSREYLENRLVLAWQAGVEYGRKNPEPGSGGGG